MMQSDSIADSIPHTLPQETTIVETTMTEQAPQVMPMSGIITTTTTTANPAIATPNLNGYSTSVIHKLKPVFRGTNGPMLSANIVALAITLVCGALGLVLGFIGFILIAANIQDTRGIPPNFLLPTSQKHFIALYVFSTLLSPIQPIIMIGVILLSLRAVHFPWLTAVYVFALAVFCVQLATLWVASSARMQLTILYNGGVVAGTNLMISSAVFSILGAFVILLSLAHSWLFSGLRNVAKMLQYKEEIKTTTVAPTSVSYA